ncbi:hypothetical protein ADUPG1_008010, partial [Aduncisulcus paluster]
VTGIHLITVTLKRSSERKRGIGVSIYVDDRLLCCSVVSSKTKHKKSRGQSVRKELVGAMNNNAIPFSQNLSAVFTSPRTISFSVGSVSARFVEAEPWEKIRREMKGDGWLFVSPLDVVMYNQRRKEELELRQRLLEERKRRTILNAKHSRFSCGRGLSGSYSLSSHQNNLYDASVMTDNSNNSQRRTISRRKSSMSNGSSPVSASMYEYDHSLLSLSLLSMSLYIGNVDINDIYYIRSHPPTQLPMFLERKPTASVRDVELNFTVESDLETCSNYKNGQSIAHISASKLIQYSQRVTEKLGKLAQTVSHHSIDILSNLVNPIPFILFHSSTPLSMQLRNDGKGMKQITGFSSSKGDKVLIRPLPAFSSIHPSLAKFSFPIPSTIQSKHIQNDTTPTRMFDRLNELGGIDILIPPLSLAVRSCVERVKKVWTLGALCEMQNIKIVERWKADGTNEFIDKFNSQDEECIESEKIKLFNGNFSSKNRYIYVNCDESVLYDPIRLKNEFVQTKREFHTHISATEQRLFHTFLLILKLASEKDTVDTFIQLLTMLIVHSHHLKCIQIHLDGPEHPPIVLPPPSPLPFLLSSRVLSAILSILSIYLTSPIHTDRAMGVCVSVCQFFSFLASSLRKDTVSGVYGYKESSTKSRGVNIVGQQKEPIVEEKENHEFEHKYIHVRGSGCWIALFHFIKYINTLCTSSSTYTYIDALPLNTQAAQTFVINVPIPSQEERAKQRSQLITLFTNSGIMELLNVLLCDPGVCVSVAVAARKLIGVLSLCEKVVSIRKRERQGYIGIRKGVISIGMQESANMSAFLFSLPPFSSPEGLPPLPVDPEFKTTNISLVGFGFYDISSCLMRSSLIEWVFEGIEKRIRWSDKSEFDFASSVNPSVSDNMLFYSSMDVLDDVLPTEVPSVITKSCTIENSEDSDEIEKERSKVVKTSERKPFSLPLLFIHMHTLLQMFYSLFSLLPASFIHSMPQPPVQTQPNPMTPLLSSFCLSTSSVLSLLHHWYTHLVLYLHKPLNGEFGGKEDDCTTDSRGIRLCAWDALTKGVYNRIFTKSISRSREGEGLLFSFPLLLVSFGLNMEFLAARLFGKPSMNLQRKESHLWVNHNLADVVRICVEKNVCVNELSWLLQRCIVVKNRSHSHDSSHSTMNLINSFPPPQPCSSSSALSKTSPVVPLQAFPIPPASSSLLAISYPLVSLFLYSAVHHNIISQSNLQWALLHAHSHMFVECESHCDHCYGICSQGDEIFSCLVSYACLALSTNDLPSLMKYEQQDDITLGNRYSPQESDNPITYSFMSAVPPLAGVLVSLCTCMDSLSALLSLLSLGFKALFISNSHTHMHDTSDAIKGLFMGEQLSNGRIRIDKETENELSKFIEKKHSHEQSMVSSPLTKRDRDSPIVVEFDDDETSETKREEDEERSIPHSDNMIILSLPLSKDTLVMSSMTLFCSLLMSFFDPSLTPTFFPHLRELMLCLDTGEARGRMIPPMKWKSAKRDEGPRMEICSGGYQALFFEKWRKGHTAVREGRSDGRTRSWDTSKSLNHVILDEHGNEKWLKHIVDTSKFDRSPHSSERIILTLSSLPCFTSSLFALANSLLFLTDLPASSPNFSNDIFVILTSMHSRLDVPIPHSLTNTFSIFLLSLCSTLSLIRDSDASLHAQFELSKGQREMYTTMYTWVSGCVAHHCAGRFLRKEDEKEQERRRQEKKQREREDKERRAREIAIAQIEAKKREIRLLETHPTSTFPPSSPTLPIVDAGDVEKPSQASFSSKHVDLPHHDEVHSTSDTASSSSLPGHSLFSASPLKIVQNVDLLLSAVPVSPSTTHSSITPTLLCFLDYAFDSTDMYKALGNGLKNYAQGISLEEWDGKEVNVAQLLDREAWLARDDVIMRQNIPSKKRVLQSYLSSLPAIFLTYISMLTVIAVYADWNDSSQAALRLIRRCLCKDLPSPDKFKDSSQIRSRLLSTGWRNGMKGILEVLWGVKNDKPLHKSWTRKGDGYSGPSVSVDSSLSGKPSALSIPLPSPIPFSTHHKTKQKPIIFSPQEWLVQWSNYLANPHSLKVKKGVKSQCITNHQQFLDLLVINNTDTLAKNLQQFTDQFCDCLLYLKPLFKNVLVFPMVFSKSLMTHTQNQRHSMLWRMHEEKKTPMVSFNDENLVIFPLSPCAHFVDFSKSFASFPLFSPSKLSDLSQTLSVWCWRYLSSTNAILSKSIETHTILGGIYGLREHCPSIHSLGLHDSLTAGGGDCLRISLKEGINECYVPASEGYQYPHSDTPASLLKKPLPPIAESFKLLAYSALIRSYSHTLPSPLSLPMCSRHGHLVCIDEKVRKKKRKVSETSSELCHKSESSSSSKFEETFSQLSYSSISCSNPGLPIPMFLPLPSLLPPSLAPIAVIHSSLLSHSLDPEEGCLCICQHRETRQIVVAILRGWRVVGERRQRGCAKRERERRAKDVTSTLEITASAKLQSTIHREGASSLSTREGRIYSHLSHIFPGIDDSLSVITHSYPLHADSHLTHLTINALQGINSKVTDNENSNRFSSPSTVVHGSSSHSSSSHYNITPKYLCVNESESNMNTIEKIYAMNSFLSTFDESTLSSTLSTFLPFSLCPPHWCSSLLLSSVHLCDNPIPTPPIVFIPLSSLSSILLRTFSALPSSLLLSTTVGMKICMCVGGSAISGSICDATIWGEGGRGGSIEEKKKDSMTSGMKRKDKGTSWVNISNVRQKTLPSSLLLSTTVGMKICMCVGGSAISGSICDATIWGEGGRGGSIEEKKKDSMTSGMKRKDKGTSWVNISNVRQKSDTESTSIDSTDSSVVDERKQKTIKSNEYLPQSSVSSHSLTSSMIFSSNSSSTICTAFFTLISHLLHHMEREEPRGSVWQNPVERVMEFTLDVCEEAYSLSSEVSTSLRKRISALKLSVQDEVKHRLGIGITANAGTQSAHCLPLIGGFIDLFLPQKAHDLEGVIVDDHFSKLLLNLCLKESERWKNGLLTNFDYLSILNLCSGRSELDLTQYPVFPWILNHNKDSNSIDFSDPKSFRDLSIPMGCQDHTRRERFIQRYNDAKMAYDMMRKNGMAHVALPPFHYGTHYSSSAVVLHYLVRVEPYSSQHVILQSGVFDQPDRLFTSVCATWRAASSLNMADVKELIPEFFYLPSLFTNQNVLNFGQSQETLKPVND